MLRERPDGAPTPPPPGPEVTLDPAASFEVLYTEAAGRLVLQIYLVTGDIEEARDCVHEGFARAWMRWEDLAPTGDPLAWIYTVSYRVAVSRFRRTLTRDRNLRRIVAEESLPGRRTRHPARPWRYASPSAAGGRRRSSDRGDF